MSDLRSACIEAMERAIDVPGDTTDAAAALDALLGVLEEHADEQTATGRFLRRMTLIGLLAVLREETQE